MIDSAMTIALSTSIPRAMTSAASETWSRPMPSSAIRNSDMTIAAGTRLATTSPVRNPSTTSRTATTMPTA